MAAERILSTATTAKKTFKIYMFSKKIVAAAIKHTIPVASFRSGIFIAKLINESEMNKTIRSRLVNSFTLLPPQRPT